MKFRGTTSNGFDLGKCYPGHDSKQEVLTINRTPCANVNDTFKPQLL